MWCGVAARAPRFELPTPPALRMLPAAGSTEQCVNIHIMKLSPRTASVSLSFSVARLVSRVCGYEMSRALARHGAVCCDDRAFMTPLWIYDGVVSVGRSVGGSTSTAATATAATSAARAVAAVSYSVRCVVYAISNRIRWSACASACALITLARVCIVYCALCEGR